MKRKNSIDPVEVKKKNILHHDVEADFFEIIHPEGSSIYERLKVLRDINLIRESLEIRSLCVDIGCGTGFLTSFELPRYRFVVATDISRRMLEVVKKRFKTFEGLNLLLCDAENLPLKSEIADMVSVSSVLHHLPNPFRSILQMSRILRNDGILYIIREPNDVRFRRFFNFLDDVMIRGLIEFMHCLPFLRKRKEKSDILKEILRKDGLSYKEVDVHCPNGFNIEELLHFLSLNHFKVISAHSYHWIFFDVLSNVNFVIEKIPLSDKFGRYTCFIVRKSASDEKENTE